MGRSPLLVGLDAGGLDAARGLGRGDSLLRREDRAVLLLLTQMLARLSEANRAMKGGGLGASLLPDVGDAKEGGPAKGDLRVRGGGPWFDPSQVCRSAYRAQGSAGDKVCNLGFRVACIAARGPGRR